MADLLLLVLDDVVEEQKMDAATRSYFAEGAGAPSWPAAEWTRSTLRDGNHIKAQLRGKHGSPREYIIHMPGSKTAACAAFPAGKSIISVYADALDAGLRVPVAGFQAALLRHYGLAPSQLTPSAWRYVSAFELLCRDAGVEPVPSLFRCFFSLCTRRGDDAGWHYFQTRRQAPRAAPPLHRVDGRELGLEDQVLPPPGADGFAMAVSGEVGPAEPEGRGGAAADRRWPGGHEQADARGGGIDFGFFLSGRRRLSPAPAQLQTVVVKREPVEEEQQQQIVVSKRARSPDPPTAAAPALSCSSASHSESDQDLSIMLQNIQMYIVKKNNDFARHKEVKEQLQAARARSFTILKKLPFDTLNPLIRHILGMDKLGMLTIALCRSML